jgi:hypothetical protein
LGEDPDSLSDYPDRTILTIEQVAEWVGVHIDIVKLWSLPRLNLPTWANDRISARQVRAYLEGRDWR